MKYDQEKEERESPVDVFGNGRPCPLLPPNSKRFVVFDDGVAYIDANGERHRVSNDPAATDKAGCEDASNCAIAEWTEILKCLENAGALRSDMCKKERAVSNWIAWKRGQPWKWQKWQ